MGFRKDAYAKVWKVEDKGNYSICQVSISKKNKETNQYEVEFQDGFVRFVGKAHEDIKAMGIPERGGLSIKITACDVTNTYVKEKGKTYVNYVVFGFETPDGVPSTASKTTAKAAKADDEPKFAELDDEDKLPF